MLREKNEDSTMSEDWVSVNNLGKYVENQEILSLMMLDHNNTVTGIKEKYVFMMLAEGVFMSIKL